MDSRIKSPILNHRIQTTPIEPYLIFVLHSISAYLINQIIILKMKANLNMNNQWEEGSLADTEEKNRGKREMKKLDNFLLTFLVKRQWLFNIHS